jgi:hypothetical protein
MFRTAHLKAGEEIVAWGSGYICGTVAGKDRYPWGGCLVVTNNRVAFYRKGWFSEILETIPLRSITSIERRRLLWNRAIRLHTSHDALEFTGLNALSDKAISDAIEAGRA